MHIRKDDIVEIIAGDDAGTTKERVTRRVLRVIPDANKIVVEGIRKVDNDMEVTDTRKGFVVNAALAWES